MNDIIGNDNKGHNRFGSNVTFDTINNRVFKHEVFGIGRRFTIPATGTPAYILIDPTENGPYTKDVMAVLPFSIKAYGGGPIEVDVFINPVVTPATGTLWSLTDRNQNTPIVPHTVVRYNPTVTNVGTLAFEDDIFSASGVGIHADIGGEVKADLLLLPNTSLKFLVRLQNTSGTAARGVFSYNQLETP